MERFQKKYNIIFIIPALIVVIVLLIFPMVIGIEISLTNLDYMKNTDSFVGLKNYIKAFSDKLFYFSVIRNITYVIIVTSFNFIIGYWMAIICYQKFRLNKLFRFIIILPMLLIPASAGLLWRFLYNYDIGIINKILTVLGFAKVGWLIDPNLALISVIITDIWAWTPWMFLILLAGIENVDKQILEAANIDGANFFQLNRYIIIPVTSPIIKIAISLKAIETFRTFDYIWIMTRGGPGGASDITSTYIFKQATRNLQYGYSSTMGIIVLIIMVLLSFFIVRKWIMKVA